MNGELKPTPLPEDLRSALHVILERARHDDYHDVMVRLRDDVLGDALEVVRCHLVGITTTNEDGGTNREAGDEGRELMTSHEPRPLAEQVVRNLREGAYQGHYGGCPICGYCEGPFNVLRENWFICSRHRVRWCAGINLFDHLEGEWEAWEFIDQFLSRFREIPASETLSPAEEACEDGR